VTGLPRVTHAEVAGALRRLGFTPLRGSSRWRHADGRVAVLHLHPGEQMKLGTLREMLRKARFPLEDFRKAL